jgi:hypothetical protein
MLDSVETQNLASLIIGVTRILNPETQDFASLQTWPLDYQQSAFIKPSLT